MRRVVVSAGVLLFLLAVVVIDVRRAPELLPLGVVTLVVWIVVVVLDVREWLK